MVDLQNVLIISDDFYMERAERSLQAPPPKMSQSSHPKKCREASTTKNATKQLPLKNAAKKAASKYAVNAALLKNAVKQLSRRCYVIMLCLSSPHKKFQSSPPQKKIPQAATTKCFTAAPLEISLHAPPDIETITVDDVP